VYQALRQGQPASLAVPTQAVEAIPASSQQQTLVVNTTEDETLQLEVTLGETSKR